MKCVWRERSLATKVSPTVSRVEEVAPMTSPERELSQPSLKEDGYLWPPLPARRMVRQIARQIAGDRDGSPAIPMQRDPSE